MSKIKSILPEDYSIEGYEPDYEPEKVPEEYYLLASIEGDIRRLGDYTIDPSCADDLRKYATTLNQIADKAERPF